MGIAPSPFYSLNTNHKQTAVIKTKPQQLNTMFACSLVLITAVCLVLAFKG